MLSAMNWLTVLPPIALAVAIVIAYRWRGWLMIAAPQPGRQKAEQPHRQAIHHFASGALPPWR